jgi:hypothetical protein
VLVAFDFRSKLTFSHLFYKKKTTDVGGERVFDGKHGAGD